MDLGDMRLDKENLALLFSIALLASVFLYSSYFHLNPPERVWEVKIFECTPMKSHTYVAGYGGGHLRMNGIWDLEKGATYRITYVSTRLNWADRILDIEKIET